MNPVSLFPARSGGPSTGALDIARRDGETRPDAPRFELPDVTDQAKPSERRMSTERPERGFERAELARHRLDEAEVARHRLDEAEVDDVEVDEAEDAEHDAPPEPRPELVLLPLPDTLGAVEPLTSRPHLPKGDADRPDTKAERAKPEGTKPESTAPDTERMAAPRVARPDDARPASQSAPQPQSQPQAQTQPAQAQVALPASQALAEVVLDEQAMKKALQPVTTDVPDVPEAPTALDDLGLRFTERVLGVAHGSAPPAPHSQVRADLAGDVAEAVHKLLADAADEQSVMRFRTEGGQTFIAQSRVDANGMELRLLSEDPAVRAMLQQRLDDLRTALHRVGFGDAQVQVDRDHTGADRGPRPQEPQPESDAPPPPKARHPFAAPDAAPPGRLHLIL